MKKLICASDIETLAQEGKQTVYVDEYTIITPSAKDAIDLHKMSVQKEALPEVNALCDLQNKDVSRVLKVLESKGLLEDLLKLLVGKPYQVEKHKSGFQLINGKTLTMSEYDTGMANTNVTICEFEAEQGTPKTGIVEIHNSNYSYILPCSETLYILEGTVTYTIQGDAFTAHQGDVVRLPKEQKINCSVTNQAKYFYVI